MTLSRIRWGVLAVLVLVNAVILYGVLRPNTQPLRISILDVGQGDSILIQSPTGVNVLVDGGPDRSVVRELPKRMGPLDRTIDLMVETHPDKDHIAGLADVLEMYEVKNFMNPGVPNDTNVFARLVADVEKEPGVSVYTALRGQRIHLGDGAYADVLYPDHDVSRLRATNDASIVLQVVYGETSFMLTGDMPSTIEDKLVASVSPESLKSDVLKAGHHGSKYSTNDGWLRAVAPSTVVISAGKGNTYGHPAPEVLARVQKFGARLLSTIDSGTIIFESDGHGIRQK
ncbi:MAG: MBL fold metallo-hydrolase [Patescibacteria group bacterium]